MLRNSHISLRRISVILGDAIIAALSLAFAIFLRFEFTLPAEFATAPLHSIPIVLIVYPCVLYFCSVYKGVYYYSSFADLLTLGRGVALSGMASGAVILFALQGRFPRSVILLHPLLVFLGSGGLRVLIRWAKTRLNMPRAYSGRERNVLLVGAGDLGEGLVRQILKTPSANYRVVGFLDDDPGKWGLRVHGYPVLGGRTVLGDVLERFQIDEIIIAVGTRRGEILSDLVERLRTTANRPELKIAPSLSEMFHSPGHEVSIRKVRPVDLLNRDVIRLDENRILRALRDRRILVTGAGGTIGAELVRQVLRYRPAEVCLVESHSTSLFHIDREARKLAQGAHVLSILGDVRDGAFLNRLFHERRPQIVLHAAAHKHVHQIETNIQEGIQNNSLATHALCEAAAKHGTETFLLVSTDKAVKPSSVMGATKRLAEMIVACYSARNSTKYLAVRFGNVLGSSGSVLPIFQSQIEQGGPLTITHPDVRRYFMTVEEAVSLILQGVAMARGGEVFVLKMGDPVRIADMARNLILLSGLEPGKDIKIQFTGLRQGEKMDEELVEDPNGCDESEHPQLMVLRNENPPRPDLIERLLELEIAIRGSDAPAVLRRLRDLVPTFKPDPAHLGVSDSETGP